MVAYEIETGEMDDGSWAYILHANDVGPRGIIYLGEDGHGSGFADLDEAMKAAAERLDEWYGKGCWKRL